MSNKTIYKRALKLAVPMMIQNGITNMVSLIDNVMVGSLGTEAMTAVSIVGQLIFVFNLAIFGGLSGPGIYGAQFYGQNNIEGVRNTFRIKQWICGFCLLIGLSVFIFKGEALIGLYLHGESDIVDPVMTMKYAKQYLTIMLGGLLPFAVTQIYASSLRETGDSIKPMVAGVSSVVIDIVFNYMLIYGHFGMPKLGVQGAALATVLARVVEMCIVVIWSFARRKKHKFLQGIYRTFLVPKELTVKIIKKGLPIFFNEFLWAGGLAALTPVIVEASHKGNHFKFAKIARIFGGVTAEDLAGKLRSLLKDIDLACTLSDLGLSEEDIPWMAENCMKVSAASIQNNPVVFTQEEIAEIYRKAM